MKKPKIKVKIFVQNRSLVFESILISFYLFGLLLIEILRIFLIVYLFTIVNGFELDTEITKERSKNAYSLYIF